MTKKQYAALHKLDKKLTTISEADSATRTTNLTATNEVSNIICDYLYGGNTLAQTKRHMATLKRTLERDLKLINHTQVILNNCPERSNISHILEAEQYD